MRKKIIRRLKDNVIVWASFMLSAVTCLVKLTGYVEKVLLARHWGTGYEADAYNAVFAFIFSIFVFFREIVEPGFLAGFLNVKRESGEKESWRVFFSIFWCLIPAGMILSLFLFLWPNTVTHIVLPGFSGECFTLTADLMKSASSACVFLILSTLTYIALNAYKRFTVAAMGDLAFKLTIVLGIFLFAERMGIYAAIYGIALGAVVKLTIHAAALWKNIPWDYGFHSGYMRSIWVLTWPLLIGIIFSQISSLVDNVFASYFREGCLSALSYSKKIVELPVVIFPYTLSIVIFPFFSRLHIARDTGCLRGLLRKTLTWITLVFVPLAVFLFFFSETVTRLVFQHGAFDAESTLLTAEPLAVYALGMPAFAVETVLVVFYFSLADTKTPVFTGIGCVIVNIVITWILVQTIGHQGIAWGLVVSKTLKVTILLYLLKYKKIA
jgi:murein biosynthesis integral membrane protein MurJ